MTHNANRPSRTLQLSPLQQPLIYRIPQPFFPRFLLLRGVEWTGGRRGLALEIKMGGSLKEMIK